MNVTYQEMIDLIITRNSASAAAKIRLTEMARKADAFKAYEKALRCRWYIAKWTGEKWETARNNDEWNITTRRLIELRNESPGSVFRMVEYIEDVPQAPAVETYHEQIDRLANFIMAEIPGEPSQNEGAIDTAIRWMRKRRHAGTSEQVRKAIVEIYELTLPNGAYTDDMSIAPMLDAIREHIKGTAEKVTHAAGEPVQPAHVAVYDEWPASRPMFYVERYVWSRDEWVREAGPATQEQVNDYMRGRTGKERRIVTVEYSDAAHSATLSDAPAKREYYVQEYASIIEQEAANWWLRHGPYKSINEADATVKDDDRLAWIVRKAEPHPTMKTAFRIQYYNEDAARWDFMPIASNHDTREAAEADYAHLKTANKTRIVETNYRVEQPKATST